MRNLHSLMAFAALSGGLFTSGKGKSQMSTLIDWLQAFGDEHQVRWTEQQEAA